MGLAESARVRVKIRLKPITTPRPLPAPLNIHFHTLTYLQFTAAPTAYFHLHITAYPKRKRAHQPQSGILPSLPLLEIAAFSTLLSQRTLQSPPFPPIDHIHT